MEKIALNLPYPPSVNSYWRNLVVNGKSRVVLSAQGRLYRKNVMTQCWASKIKSVGKRPLGIEVILYPPDNRKRDLDNVCKALLDALEHAGVYEDDSQIMRLTLQKSKTKKGGEVNLTIGILSEEDK